MSERRALTDNGELLAVSPSPMSIALLPNLLKSEADTVSEQQSFRSKVRRERAGWGWGVRRETQPEKWTNGANDRHVMRG